MASLSRTEALRKALFVPCKTQKSLHDWVKTYLGLDIPGGIVDPSSNSSPMDLLWELYSKALNNNDPKYRRVLAYAARDSFKCSKEGTLLLSRDKGLIPIEQINVGDTIWSGKTWKPVSDRIDDGIKESRVLTLKNGASIEVSPIHKVWAWEPGSFPCWKTVSDLTPDDVVKWDTDSGFCTSPIDQAEYDIGYLCGILQGDGCLRFMDKCGRISLSTIDPYVLSFWKKTCLSVSNREPKQSKSRPCDWFINSREFCTYLKSLGLTTGYSYEKDFPQRCMQNRSVMVGFISGILDTDGSVGSRKDIVFSMSAEKLLRKMVVCLAALGISSKFRTLPLYPQHGQKHQMHMVVVSQNEIPKMLGAGIKLNAHKAQFITVAQTPDAHDAIPAAQLKILLDKIPSKGGRWVKRVGRKPRSMSYKTITRAKLDNLLNFSYNNNILMGDQLAYWKDVIKTPWIRVVSVKKNTAHFYDVTVDEDHSYWSNGVISHNTIAASIFEVLCLVHLERSVCHLAAIMAQSKKAQKYIKNFFQRPFLRDFIVSDNERSIVFVRYYDADTGNSISVDTFKELPKLEQDRYVRKENYISLVVCTVQGANSEHTPFLCVDGETKLQTDIDGEAVLTAEELFYRLAGENGNRICLTSGGAKIEDPSIRISVLGMNLETSDLEFKPITKAFLRDSDTLKISTKNHEIICTPDHPLFVLGKYIEAKDLIIGDCLYTIGGYLESIKKIEPAGVRQVFDFTVADNHNFFGNGILNKNCIDEVDVIPKQNLSAYEEAQMIPCVYEGKLPITLLISSRKYSFGKVQMEIDDASPSKDDPEGSGTIIRHWNLLDVTERCPSTRHQPEKGKVVIYRSDDTLKAISPKQWESLEPDQQAKYIKDTGCYGCLNNCTLFAVCKGALIHKSDKWYEHSLLKPIDFTIGSFKSVSAPTAKAQLLCWRPSEEGLIYSNLDRSIHMLTAAQIMEKLTGERQDKIIFKDKLFDYMKEKGLIFACGIDWGFTHLMSTVLIAVDGARAFVIGAWSRPKLDPGQKLNFLKNTIKKFDPIIFADTESPDMNQLVKKAGYRIRDWSKEQGSVLGGIEIVRLKLAPASGDPELYFLGGDDGVEELFRNLQRYHWEIGLDGKPSDKPDKEGDDPMDATRYVIMNIFKGKGRVLTGTTGTVNQQIFGKADVGVENTWARQMIDEIMEGSSVSDQTVNKKGSFYWSMG
jgi:Pretoxin HINT domain/LAGLIDADG-like domain